MKRKYPIVETLENTTKKEQFNFERFTFKSTGRQLGRYINKLAVRKNI